MWRSSVQTFLLSQNVSIYHYMQFVIWSNTFFPPNNHKHVHQLQHLQIHMLRNTLAWAEAGRTDGPSRRSPGPSGRQSGSVGSAEISLSLWWGSCSRGSPLLQWWDMQRPIQQTEHFQIHTCQRYTHYIDHPVDNFLFYYQRSYNSSTDHVIFN